MTTTKSAVQLRQMVFCAVLAAIIAIAAQISFPLPSGVPVTLQTFAVALAGAFLGWKWGTISTAVYLALGAVGIPVFAGFSGGIYKLVGITGGYLWGFLLLALLCGIGAAQKKWYVDILLGIAGLLLCHTAGVIQFTIFSGGTLWNAILTASLPYIIKDIISVILAQRLAAILRNRLQAMGIFSSRGNTANS